MNFDIATGYRDLIFSKSVRPMEIKEETKNWKLLQGYVYVMSKKFRPFPEDTERLLIKIGYSDFEADVSGAHPDSRISERYSLYRSDSSM